MAGSLVTGLVVGLLLAAAPFIPAEESAVTGALLCGFALGWAMLAVLSMAMKGFPSETESHTGPVTKRPLAQPSTVAP